MEDLVAIVIAVVVVSALGGAMFVSHELHHESTPLVFRRRAARRLRRVTPGTGCVCGGTIGRTGRISRRFGELLGCTACRRLWTTDGRRIIIQRRRRPAGEDGPQSAGRAVS